MTRFTKRDALAGYTTHAFLNDTRENICGGGRDGLVASLRGWDEVNCDECKADPMFQLVMRDYHKCFDRMLQEMQTDRVLVANSTPVTAKYLEGMLLQRARDVLPEILEWDRLIDRGPRTPMFRGKRRIR